MNSRRHLILQWAVVLGFLVSVPFIRFAIGDLPTDDGLRHVAQAISGRPWTDVTFIREDCRMDHSPRVELVSGRGPPIDRHGAEGALGPGRLRAFCLVRGGRPRHQPGSHFLDGIDRRDLRFGRSCDPRAPAARTPLCPFHGRLALGAASLHKAQDDQARSVPHGGDLRGLHMGAWHLVSVGRAWRRPSAGKAAAPGAGVHRRLGDRHLGRGGADRPSH